MDSNKVYKHILKNPGQTCAEMATALGEEPAVVSVALRELKQADVVKTKGNTRGQKYTAK